MELEYAFLADKADRTQDGKLVVLGGDIDSVIVPDLPTVLQLSLVARLMLGPDEPLAGHTFGIEATSSTEAHTVVAHDMPLHTKRNSEEPDQPSSARLILNLSIAVMTAGVHFIHLLIDGREVKAIRFRVNHSPQSEVAQ